MSDEEKKAIQMIKNQKEEVDEALIAMEIPENYIGEDVEQEYLEWQKNADIILNLIEKQSKEIEEAEQKEKQAYIDGTNAADKLCNEKWERKIKAMLENEIINISGFECVAKEDVQSLLQEEENNEC